VKRHGHLYIFFILAALTFTMPTGCDEKSGSDGPVETSMEGITTLETVIGPEGGRVEITDPDSLIYRAGAYVQPAALSEDIPITVSRNGNHENWNSEIIAAGEVVRFDPDGISFDKPVELFLPYKDEDNDGLIDGTEIGEENVRAMFYNQETGMWKDVPINNINTEDNTVSFETDHFSDYTPATYLTRVCNVSESLTCGPYYFTLYFDFRHGSESNRASVSGVGVDLNAGNASIVDASRAVLEEEGFINLFERVIDARQWTWTWEVIPSMTFLTKSVGIEDDEVEVEITVTGPTTFEFLWNFDYALMAPDEMLAVKFSGSTDTLCQLLDRTPRIPQNVTIGDITENSISISWDEIVYVYSTVSYNIYISEDGGGTFSFLTSISDPAIVASGLDSDTTYFFKVTAVYFSDVESADSQAVSATTL
jgi:Fibronectin type III domain